MLYPLAVWLPSPNFAPGHRYKRRFIALHREQGSEAGTESWFHSRVSQVSAHIGIGKDGRVAQFVDTANVAWAQVKGNGVAISIELEGFTNEKLTNAQYWALVSVIAWVHETQDIPLRVCVSAQDTLGGLIGHGEGAATGWGGDHFNCPGSVLLSLRPRIIKDVTALIARAKGLPTPAQAHRASVLHRLHLRKILPD